MVAECNVTSIPSTYDVANPKIAHEIQAEERPLC